MWKLVRHPTFVASATAISLLVVAVSSQQQRNYGRPKHGHHGVARPPKPPSIYPDDHWSYSTKLTPENFKDTIQKEIDAGRTFFVRWIASSG